MNEEPTNTPEAPPTPGQVIKWRRSQLGLSQSGLAWYARVSRNTISNLERGEGVPESATLQDVAASLGMDWRDLANPRPESRLDSLDVFMASSVQSRLFEIIASDKLSPKESRKLADGFREYIKVVAEAPHSWDDQGAQRMLDVTQRSFITSLQPHLSFDASADESLIEWLRDLGWSPEDSLPVVEKPEKKRRGRILYDEKPKNPSVWKEPEVPLERLTETLSNEMWKLRKELQKTSDRARQFDRLPLGIQEVLTSGSIAQHEVSEMPGGFAVNLYIRSDETDVAPPKTLAAILKWTQLQEVVHVASTLLEKREVDALDDPFTAFEVMEIALLAKVSMPDVVSYLRKRFPERLEELRRRWGDSAPDYLWEEDDESS